jgi:hypothetical protein
MIMRDKRNYVFPMAEEISFWISSIFVVLCMVCSFFETTPDLIRVITAVISLLVFTYFVGKAVLQIFNVLQFDGHGLLFKVVSYVLIGLIVSSTVFYVLGSLHLFTAPLILGYLSSLLLAYLYRSKFRPVKYWSKKIVPRESFKNIVAVLVTSLSCFLIALWIQPISSFPYVVGWDLYTNMLTVRTILTDDGISELNLLYLPTPHYFYAMISILTGLDPFTTYWGSIYFLLPMAGASLFFLGYSMSKNIPVGVCTAILGVSIGASNETLGFIFPYSSTFGLVINILCCTVLLNTNNKKFMFTYVISVMLVYPFALFANMVLLVGIMSISKQRKMFLLSVLISALAFVLLAYFGGYYLARFPGTIFSTEQVLSILSSLYGGEKGLLLVALGFIFIFINKSFDRRFGVIIISVGISLLIMISGVYNVGYRLEEFMRPFVALIGGYGLGSFAIFSGKTIHDLFIRRTRVLR